MAKKGHSSPNIWGGYNHYDENDRKIGESNPGFFSGYNHYDAKGHKTGSSTPGVFGGYNHYDSHCRKTGRADPGILGSYNHNNTGGHMLQPVYTTPITAHRSGLCAVSGITPCLRLLPGVRLFEFITPLVPPL